MPSEGVVSSWSAEPTPDGAGGGFLCLPAGAQGQCQQKAGQGGGKAKAVEFHGDRSLSSNGSCVVGGRGRRWLGGLFRQAPVPCVHLGDACLAPPLGHRSRRQRPLPGTPCPPPLCSEMDICWGLLGDFLGGQGFDHCGALPDAVNHAAELFFAAGRIHGRPPWPVPPA